MENNLERAINSVETPILQDLINKYGYKCNWLYEKFSEGGDSEVGMSIWSKDQADARRLFDIYCEVLNDLNSIR